MNQEPQSIKEYRQLISTGQASAAELLAGYVQRSQQLQPLLNSYITLDTDSVKQKIESLTKNNLTSLDLPAVPIAHKDNIMIKGQLTTSGAEILANYQPQYTATVANRLDKAGAISLGKTNLDAFGHGSTTENSHFGPSRNPWNTQLSPGGSSGGSAVAVSAGQVLAATATDTGGSIRLPAAHTNTVGLKPTYGRVSRYGVMAMSSSMDSVGFLTRTVEDSAIMLQVVAGRDQQDGTTSNNSVPNYLQSLDQPLSGLKIGLIPEFMNSEAISPEVKQVIEESVRQFERLGVSFIPIDLPHLKASLAAYYILSSAEISSNLGRLDGIRYGVSDGQAAGLQQRYLNTRSNYLGAEAKRRLILGAHVLSSDHYQSTYVKAQQARTLIIDDFTTAFKQVQGILAPVSPNPPLELGHNQQDPLATYIADSLTVPVSLAGLPALAIPAGFVDNLPVGLQLIGPSWSEDQLLNWGHQYQLNTDWHLRRPSGLE